MAVSRLPLMTSPTKDSTGGAFVLGIEQIPHQDDERGKDYEGQESEQEPELDNPPCEAFRREVLVVFHFSQFQCFL